MSSKPTGSNAVLPADIMKELGDLITFLNTRGCEAIDPVAGSMLNGMATKILNAPAFTAQDATQAYKLIKDNALLPQLSDTLCAAVDKRLAQGAEVLHRLVKPQVLININAFLTGRDWEILRKPTASVEQKMLVLVHRRVAWQNI